MLIQKLQNMGVNSDMAFLAAGASIALSIVTFRGGDGRDSGPAQRRGIFVGLWAPTFMVIGAVLKLEEKA